MRGANFRAGGALIALSLLLGACAESQLLIHAAKQGTPSPGNPSGGLYKVGSPYQLNGVWYYPAEDYDYNETGIASWYGKEFHGKVTANGEIYDMNKISAAHRTLPMPSVVRVTNLDNGREIVVRLNDRGPFAHGRIIDMSRRGAQLLGFEGQGTAKVRVQIIADESRQMAMAARGLNQTAPDSRSIAGGGGPVPSAAPRETVVAQALLPPSGTAAPLSTSQPPVMPARPPAAIAQAPGTGVATQSLPPLPGAPQAAPPQVAALPSSSSASSPVAARGPATVVTAAAREATKEAQTDTPVTTVAPSGGANQIYVQAGAFANANNALRLQGQLAALGPTSVNATVVQGQNFYRVRVGPLASVAEADRTLERLIGSGHQAARVVVD